MATSMVSDLVIVPNFTLFHKNNDVRLCFNSNVLLNSSKKNKKQNTPLPPPAIKNPLSVSLHSSSYNQLLF